MYAVMAPKEYELTEEESVAITNLRKSGCAVTVFLPQEMGTTSNVVVEKIMVQAGWLAID